MFEDRLASFTHRFEHATGTFRISAIDLEVIALVLDRQAEEL